MQPCWQDIYLGAVYRALRPAPGEHLRLLLLTQRGLWSLRLGQWLLPTLCCCECYEVNIFVYSPSHQFLG